MGRSRRRDRRAGIGPQPRHAAATATATAPAGREQLGVVRRTLAVHLGGSVLLALGVLAGTVLIAGKLGPWLVLAVVAAGAWALHRWSSQRFARVDLAEDERTLRTMGSGLLVLAVGFGVVAAIVLTVA
jgi:hypothetical protein